MVRSLEGKHPLYYEAILQLREVSSKVIDFVEREIISAKMPLARKVEVKNGLDYYLADNSFTKGLGRKLQQQFGGEILTSASLHTQKDGKDMYRVTILFRGAGFGKNEQVEYKGEKYLVVVLGKEIILQDVKNGKKIHLKYKEMGKIKKAV